MTIDLQLVLSFLVSLVFILLLIFSRRLTIMKGWNGLLLVLLVLGLLAQVVWPSRGAGFGTYTEAARILDSQGPSLYSVFQNPPQPEAPPMGLVILGLMYAVVPGGLWPVAVGVYQALLNGIIAFATYRLIGGKIGKVAACLVVYNPFFFVYSLLNVSPDQLMFAFVMIGLNLAKIGKKTWSSITFGLALISMQTAVFFLVPMAFYFLFRYGKRVMATFVAIVLGIFLIGSLPFALVDRSYIDHVWEGQFIRIGLGTAQHLYDPNFAGLSAYFAYLHGATGLDLSFLYALGPFVFIGIAISVIYVVYRNREIELSHLALLSLMPFYLATWNTAYGADPVNPWRLYFFVPFATIIWLQDRSLLAKTCLASILAVQLYRVADYAAFIYNPTSELTLLAPGNLVLPACFLAYLVAEISFNLRGNNHVQGHQSRKADVGPTIYENASINPYGEATTS